MGYNSLFSPPHTPFELRAQTSHSEHWRVGAARLPFLEWGNHAHHFSAPVSLIAFSVCCLPNQHCLAQCLSGCTIICTECPPQSGWACVPACAHLCTGLWRGRRRASQGLGSWRHHSGAEFYGFSCIPLIFTQSLTLEIYLPFLSYSVPTPVFPTFSQFSLGSLGPKPAARMPARSRAQLPSASHTACSSVFFSQAGPEGEMVAPAQGSCRTPATPHDPPRLSQLHATLPPMSRELSP